LFLFRKIIAVTVVMFFSLALTSCEKAQPSSASLRAGEKRATIAPEYFTGKAYKAYFAAKEIPEVLDSLYCYCDCAKHAGHLSLLTCFVSMHGQGCDVCMDEAIMAYELHQQGKDILSIRKAVDEKFAR